MGKETIWAIIAAAGTGLFSWIYSHMKTRREQKQSDLELINAAIAPLLNSIKEVTDQNSELVKKYTDEQDKTIRLVEENNKLLKERSVLVEKVDRLERHVKELTTKINSLLKKTIDDKDKHSCKYPASGK